MKKEETLVINGLKHCIHLWGDPKAPMLFLVHGFLGTGEGFEFLCRHLSQNFFCIAPDLRGFGKTEYSSNPLGYFFYEYLADLHILLHHYSPQAPVRVLGHSMGGNIVSLYAGTYPNRVGYFVNVEGFGIRDAPPSEGPERLRKWIDATQSEASFSLTPSLEKFKERLLARYPRIESSILEFMAHNLVNQVGDNQVRLKADPKHKWPNPYIYRLENIYPFLEKITAKVLLVYSKDSIIKEWFGNKTGAEQMLMERLSHYPKDSKHMVFSECGHMIHLEKPKELAEEVGLFLFREEDSKK